MNRKCADRMNIGDMVSWTNSKNHDYFNDQFRRYGILIEKLEEFEHWVLACVLGTQGKIDRVMLHKGDNPL